MKNLMCLCALLISSISMAALPAKKTAAPSKILQGEGVSFGGLAGSSFSLIDIRRTADTKKKIERIVIDVGDAEGAKMRGWPGFYYAELKKNPQRLVLDFSQMPKSFINKEDIANRLKGSLAVLKTDMSMDPIDSALNLTMDLKQNTKVRIYQVSGKKSTSKVVIDLMTE